MLGVVEVGGAEAELCVESDASYDFEKSALITHLRAFLRPTRASQPDWLPKAQTVTEKVPTEDADPLAREIFARWVAKVRASAPTIHKPVV